jgi:hypothetical protein
MGGSYAAAGVGGLYAVFENGTAKIQKIVKAHVPAHELHSEKAENPFGR